MGADFVKIYPGFFEGSLRETPPFTRLLFLAMIAKADVNGVVRGHPSFWAAYVGTTEEDIREAILILESPDPESHSPDEDGRRIIPWGEGKNCWRLVNYRKYYKKSWNEDRAEYKREWDRSHAEARHKSAPKRKNPTNPTKPDKPETESESESESETRNTCRIPRDESAFETFYEAYPKREGGMGKAKGREIFHRLIRKGTDPQKIIEGARRYAQAEADRIGTRFIKQVPAWLNQRCWEDEYRTPDDERQSMIRRLEEEFPG